MISTDIGNMIFIVVSKKWGNNFIHEKMMKKRSYLKQADDYID